MLNKKSTNKLGLGYEIWAKRVKQWKRALRRTKAIMLMIIMNYDDDIEMHQCMMMKFSLCLFNQPFPKSYYLHIVQKLNKTANSQKKINITLDFL